MTETIDFNKERMKRETSHENKLVCGDGSQWFKYYATFEFDCKEGDTPPIVNGAVYPSVKTYMIDFWAQSDDEAKSRIEAMRSTIDFGGRYL